MKDRTEDTKEKKNKKGLFLDSRKLERKVPYKMQGKMMVLFGVFFLAFIGLAIKLIYISNTKGEQYSKQILSQQEYDSKTLPFKRGDIVDANGTILAVSEKVYNLVIDAYVMNGNEGKYMESTLNALELCFPMLDMNAVRNHVTTKPSSRYYVPLKKLTYDECSAFKAMQADTSKDAPVIKGVWFEEEYKRMYPNGSLACDVIGFTTSDGTGMYGLEEYYNEILNGTTGREYGYLNSDSELERTIKPAVNGYTVVSTLDTNIQRIVEENILEFNTEYTDNYRDGDGANNVGVIIMEVNTGNVLAMAGYPVFDLNSPYDLSMYYSDSEIAAMKEADTYYSTLNGLWRNFCISDTYEPGSTFKPFTVCMGLESGILTGNEVYDCHGSLEVGGHNIHCHNRYGDGAVSVERAVAISCNVALMKMGIAIGPTLFADYQSNFNMGLKTNIDLAGEARTAELVYTADTMGSSELATGTFGQGFNVTMIQMITGFCSLINGGNYYEPHMVKQIMTSSGGVVENIQPRLLKQTISESTSNKVRKYLEAVCDPSVQGATGRSARPAGYKIGGKTGTAQTLPRGNGEYVVSFMGYAPADNPQIAVYVVIDRPNVKDQSNGTRCATNLCREIMTEVLPYMGIFMTEELSDSEIKELEERHLEDTRRYGTPESEEEEEVPGEDNPVTGDTQPIWYSFEKDPVTGYYIDPDTGEQIDPETGNVIGSNYDVLPQ